MNELENHSTPSIMENKLVLTQRLLSRHLNKSQFALIHIRQVSLQ